MSEDKLEILVVDDTPINLTMLEQLLESDDLIIRGAENGPEAIELCKQHDFALILLDVQMPDMNGYETAQGIKQIERAKSVPIIFITAIFQDPENVKQGYESGAVDYLFRPMDPYMLRSKVSVFIELHRQKQRLEQEIAQRKKTERALRRAEQKYRTIFEKAVEGIFQTNLNGDFLEANPALADMLGYERPEELLRQPGLAVGLMIDCDKRVKHLERLKNEGIVSNWEFQARRKDGEIIWLSESSRLVTSESGEPLYIEGMVEDITRRKTEEMELQRLATLDSLTGIPNRHLFFDRLEHTLASARRYSTRLAVLFIDLDNFKMVNDTCGHHAGDKLLREVADRIRARVRAADTLARLGGDEFGVLLEHIDSPESAGKVAEGILAAMEEPFEVGGMEFGVGATIGISTFPEDGDDPNFLVGRADSAMYSVKRDPECRFAFSSPLSE